MLVLPVRKEGLKISKDQMQCRGQNDEEDLHLLFDFEESSELL